MCKWNAVKKVFQPNKDLIWYNSIIAIRHTNGARTSVQGERNPLNLQFAVRVWYSKKLDMVGRSAINDVN